MFKSFDRFLMLSQTTWFEVEQRNPIILQTVIEFVYVFSEPLYSLIAL